MSWKLYSYGTRSHHGGSEADEFFEAAEMARKSVARMHELASEMESRYGERYYGMRHDGYGERENEMWDSPEYHERRRRDSMGRYM